MAYIRKTYDEWEIQGNYSGNWECETTEDNRKSAREQLKCYRDNVPGIGFRVVKKRVKIKNT